MSRPTRPASGIRSQAPPAWLMRRLVNPVVRLVALSPLARWTGQLTLLTFVTRHSGRRLQVPVLGHQLGPNLVVFTDAPWAANFRQPRPVTVTHDGRRHDGTAVLCGDPTATAAALRAVLELPTSPRRLGLSITPGYRPTDTELAALRQMLRISI